MQPSLRVTCRRPTDKSEGPCRPQRPLSADGTTNGHPAPPVDLANLTQLMGHCLSASSQAWARVEQVQYAPADIRAVGITLFLECSRRGVGLDKPTLEQSLVDQVLGHTDDLPF